MFVTVSTYLAKPGEEDAIIAIYEDWQRTLQTRVKGYLPRELLRKAEVPRKFISIMRFESQESVRSYRNDPEQVGGSLRPLVDRAHHCPGVGTQGKWKPADPGAGAGLCR